MSRLVLDAVSFKAVEATHWPHLIGYANGRVSAWTPTQIERTRGAGRLLALVDVLGTAPHQASVLDFERGDVQSPAVVAAWARARNEFARDATVYCQPASIAKVVSGLRGEPLNLWVVDLTADGEPPFTVPHYPGLPGNVRVIGRQFVFGPRSGGDYDMSIFYADDWHPEQAAPHHLFAARATAAAELGPYHNASAAAELTDPHTGQITAAPLHVVTMPEPIGEEIPCLWCPDARTCATGGRCLEPGGAVDEPAAAAAAPVVDQAAAVVDQAAAELAGAALVASAAPPLPARFGSLRIPGYAPAVDQAAADVDEPAAADVDQAADVEPTLGELLAHHAPDAAASSPSSRAADVDQAAAFAAAAAPVPVVHDDATNAALAERAGPGTAGSVATAAAVGEPGPAQPTLNHDFIRRVLVDVGDVAKQLRAGGWVHAAHELERAGAIAWELGSALKSAGL